MHMLPEPSSRPASPPTSTLPRPSWLSWTIVLAVCLSASLVGIEVWQMWHARGADLRGAKIVTASLAETLSHQVNSTLQTADSVVMTLVRRVEVDGENPESLQRLYGLMTSLAEALPAIHEMGLTDRDGNAIVKSLVPPPIALNYGDRDYFRYLSTHNSPDVFIGSPVASKIDGSVNITVSRRINAADGSFAGIVVASVSMDYFRKLFEQVQDKTGGAISLISDSGALLSGSSGSFGNSEFSALTASPAGALEYRSPNDGIDRVGSYHHLAHYPMLAMVSQDSAEILGEWHNELRVHGAIVLCTLLVIGVLGTKVERANRATRLHALRDGLTELANRRCFDETIAREVRRAARNGRALSLIMVDIDLFKSFNDQYGHPAGDACLRAVSAVVQSVVHRPGDLVARYGGEEIAVLLPETELSGAVRIVEAMLDAVHARAIPHAASPHGIITLSAGVAAWRPAPHNDGAGSLIEIADAALYAAKADGRNTFKVAPAAIIEHRQAA